MIIALILILFVVIYVLVKKQYSYWERNGIASVKPTIPFGNLKSIIKKQKSFGTEIYDIYKNTTEPFIGIYLFFRPALLIRDSVLVKNVLLNDFHHFHDRGIYCEPETDPMSATLFSLPGEKWKNLRTKLTPVFTSGKLKNMFPYIHNIGNELVKVMEPLTEKQDAIEIRSIAGRYVADCLASIAFGLEGVSTLNDPNHEFLMNSGKLNKSTKMYDIIRRSAVFLCPKLLKFLGMKGLPKFVQEFCLKIVTETIKNRETTNKIRNDLMQYLIQLKNDSTNSETVKGEKAMSNEQIAGQVFLFYIAGNETSTSTIAYTLYELTQDDNLMVRAKEDIERTLKKHNGQLTYESIMEMHFIDLCVKETLRKYPFPILNRECTKEYRIPGTETIIKKGTPVIISVLGIHRDEQYFPEPEKYDPDRFTTEKHAFNEDMYMPFGLGPRSCIAFRMGLLVSKVAIVMMLLNFKIERTCKKRT